ncbi:MAG: hypothetical protein RL417_2502 [Pseudomonadota bacterium]
MRFLNQTAQPTIRFGVIGLGYVAQSAILPAFSHTRKVAELTALISSDPTKLRELGARHGVTHLYDQTDFDAALAANTFDAVYIAVPNSCHCDFALRAAIAGKHILCETPLALTSAECKEMIRVAQEHHVRLMVGYRLHFERSNMRASAIVRSGEIGIPRIVDAVVSMQLEDESPRTRRQLFGGPMYDIGIYGINASRYLFRAEPIRVTALASELLDPRFSDVPALESAILDFGSGRLATITASYGSTLTSYFNVIGTAGTVRLSPAFDHNTPLTLEITTAAGVEREHYPTVDQFAPEIIEFARCITEHTEPESSGLEGLADVRIIEALERSASTGRRVELADFKKPRRPDLSQTAQIAPMKNSHPLVHAHPPGRSTRGG